MNSVSEKTYPQWLNLSFYNYAKQYNHQEISRDELVVRSILCMLNSYKMLTIWSNEEGSTRQEENMQECTIMWKTFCSTADMTISAVKVILSLQLSDAKAEADAFATEHGYMDFFSWLSHIDSQDVEPRALVTISTESDTFFVRPFFSVVIACYNDGRYAKDNYLDRLLSSLCNQGLEKDELEVILSDDCSPVGFEEIYLPYKDKLNIRTTKTDYNFAPGNTRQKGVDIARGEWLCFADHDDIYYPNALSTIKKFIEDNGHSYFVFSPFNGVDTTGKVLRKYDKILGWCHGKFYNIDNFWIPQHIHFIKDLKSHEDIAICTQVSCALDKMKVDISNTYLDFVTYAWTDNPQSVSHAKYSVDSEERNFLEVHFNDYLKSTGYIYLEMAKEGLLDHEYAYSALCEVLCYAYSYMQMFMFQRKDYWKENFVNSGRLLHAIKETFNVKRNADIYSKIAANNGLMFYRVRKLADNTGRYIPQQGFKQWMDAADAAYKKSLDV